MVTESGNMPSVKLKNPYWEAVLTFPHDNLLSSFGQSGRFTPDSHPGLLAGQYDEARTRTALVQKYSWAIPSDECIFWIAEQLQGRELVEIGCGTGYWAWLLGQVGIPVQCFDVAPPGQEKNHWFIEHAERFHVMSKGGAEKALDHPDKVLFLCWPPYGTGMASHALRYYKGDTLLYIGEGEGGCCADDEFFEQLKAEWTEVADFAITQWSGLHDRMTIYTRVPVIIHEAP